MGAKQWDKEMVIREIKQLRRDKQSLNTGFVQKFYSSLSQAASRYFGNWEKAIKAAGLDYSQIKLQREWSKQAVVRAIRSRKRQKLPLHVRGVEKDDGGLCVAARTYFGKNGWEKALKQAGIDPKSVVDPRRIWTKKKVLSTIRRRFREKLPLDAASLRDGRACDLLSAGTRLFKSWKKAIQAAGFDYNSITHAKVDYWNKRRILAQIRRIARTQHCLSSRFISAHRPDLRAAAIDCFGTWKRAVEVAGFSYDSVQEKRSHYWNKRKILAHIRRLGRAGNRLSQKATELENADLVTAARREFGDWGNAVEMAGFNYRLHCETWSYKAWLRRLDKGQVKTIKRQAIAFAKERRSNKGA